MSRRSTRGTDALVGLVYFVLVIAFVAVAILVYNKSFASSVDLKLQTDTVGSSLQKGSDVKLNGVPVGEVSDVTSDPDGAMLTLAIKPDYAKDLSPQTTAQLLPKTLFGERYVSLTSTGSTDGGLSNGDSINQDTSQAAAELQKVLDGLLPLLQSIQPEKLQATLSELATLLRGRGQEIGDVLEKWGDYLERLQPSVPKIASDLDKLSRVADTYADAAPDLLNALDSLTTTTKTIADQQSTLLEVYARVIDASNTTTGFVQANEQTIDILSGESRKALEAAAPYASEFPCLLKSLRQFVPRMDKALGKGTDQPGVRVVLSVAQPRTAYKPGKDAVRYSDTGRATCPYVPGTTASAAKAAASGAAPAAIAPPQLSLKAFAGESGGIGQANSPAENQLISELMAPTHQMSPDDYPDWASLVVGPALRGSKVALR